MNRRRRDSNPRMTVLQTVPLDHLGTPPQIRLHRLPRGAETLAWLRLPGRAAHAIRKLREFNDAGFRIQAGCARNSGQTAKRGVGWAQPTKPPVREWPKEIFPAPHHRWAESTLQTTPPRHVSTLPSGGRLKQARSTRSGKSLSGPVFKAGFKTKPVCHGVLPHALAPGFLPADC